MGWNGRSEMNEVRRRALKCLDGPAGMFTNAWRSSDGGIFSNK